MKNFLNISDFSNKECIEIISSAIDKKNNKKQSDEAQNKTVAMIFEKNY